MNHFWYLLEVWSLSETASRLLLIELRWSNLCFQEVFFGHPWGRNSSCDPNADDCLAWPWCTRWRKVKQAKKVIQVYIFSALHLLRKLVDMVQKVEKLQVINFLKYHQILTSIPGQSESNLGSLQCRSGSNRDVHCLVQVVEWLQQQQDRHLCLAPNCGYLKKPKVVSLCRRPLYSISMMMMIRLR